MTHHLIRRLRWIALIALILAALACNVPGQTPPPITPTPTPGAATPAPPTPAPAQPTGASQPTTEPAQPTAETGQPGGDPTPFTPPEAPAPNAEYSGISFYYDLEYASSWTSETVPPPDTSTGAPVDWLTPSHYLFTLEGYPVSSTFREPQILVIPVANYEDFNQVGPREIGRLRQILEERPAEFPPPLAGQDPLPFLPGYNAAQVFAARIEYLDFQNGSGLRYLTQYDQAVIPINNNELFYTFQGLTLDGQYYVAVLMPVSHPDLPSGLDLQPEDYAAIEQDFEGYIEGVRAMLDAADPASFTPSLELLDQLVHSIRVEP